MRERKKRISGTVTKPVSFDGHGYTKPEDTSLWVSKECYDLIQHGLQLCLVFGKEKALYIVTNCVK